MAIDDGPRDLRGALLEDVDLSDARLRRASLAGAVMRGVDIAGADIDAPWLLEDEGATLRVNGGDVVPFLQAELDRRWPGRALRRAEDPGGLRDAWAALEETWDRTIARARALPPGTVDVQVDGEWSFAQTLRHMVMAIDVWFGRSVLERSDALHPLGVPHVEYEEDGHDMSVFAPGIPEFSEVLAVFDGRMQSVRAFLADADEALLTEPRKQPWDPRQETTVRGCVHVILEERWEHHRYAVRDLDTIVARSR